jgi:hypothetical protein
LVYDFSFLVDIIFIYKINRGFDYYSFMFKYAHEILLQKLIIMYFILVYSKLVHIMQKKKKSMIFNFYRILTTNEDKCFKSEVQ